MDTPPRTPEFRPDELARVGGEAGSIDAHDRLLDHLLTELHRANPPGLPGTALVARLRAAWEAGERGEDLHDLAPVGRDSADRLRRDAPDGYGRGAALRRPGALRPRRGGEVPGGGAGQSSRPSRRVAALLAAGLALAAGLLWWTRDSGARSPDAPEVADPPDVADAAVPGRGFGGPASPPPSPRARERERLVAAAAALTPDERDALREAARRLLTPRPWIGPLVAGERAAEIRRDLLGFLRADPALWAGLTLALEDELARGWTPPSVAGEAVALARAGPAVFGTALARRLHRLVPWAFDARDLAVFADRGPFEFRRELVARALAPDAGAFVASGGVDTFAAAWLLARGDERGRAPLAHALDATSLEPDDPARLARVGEVALAGSLLRATARGDAWSRAHARVSAFVEELLARGDLQGAERATRALEAHYGAPPPPAFPLTYDTFSPPPAPADVAPTAEELRVRLAEIADWE